MKDYQYVFIADPINWDSKDFVALLRKELGRLLEDDYSILHIIPVGSSTICVLVKEKNDGV